MIQARVPTNRAISVVRFVIVVVCLVLSPALILCGLGRVSWYPVRAPYYYDLGRTSRKDNVRTLFRLGNFNLFDFNLFVSYISC